MLKRTCAKTAERYSRNTYDPVDSSVTRYLLSSTLPFKRRHSRSDLYLKNIFRDAGLNLFHQRVQDGLPKGHFMVKM
jgi:hypothetical protein